MTAERMHRYVALAALLVLGSLLVFTSLGNGPLEIYDEGLYGMYARHALHYDVWLHVVDASGVFPTGVIKFSKPPLSIWAVAASMRLLGPSLFALRLPFALATFAVALIAFAWGVALERGPRGAWLGFSWGALWLMSHGAFHYGRTATIDALLAAFVLLALYAHGRALARKGARSLGFAALAGLAISGAFLTKQLVCALAAVPIALVELARIRREGVRAPLSRALIALGLPLLSAATWLALLWHKVGKATVDVLWSHAVVSRVEGFDGLHHRNYLNRIAEQLDLDAPPLAWEVSLLGLVLLLATRVRGRGARDDALLLCGMFACGWVAFDVTAQAILPWYAFTLLPPLALGSAWLITRAVEAVLWPAPLARLPALAAGAGAAAIVSTLALATRTLLPSTLVAALAAAAVVLSVREPRLGRAAVIGLSTLAVGLATVGVMARDGYRDSEPDPLSVLASAIGAQPAKRVSLDARAHVHPYARSTFFGVDADQGSAPWRLGAKRAAQYGARIEAEVLPRGLAPRAGQRIVRAAGMYALLGDLSTPPFDRDAIASALGRGPLTFEAEDLGSEHFDTLVRSAAASGGAFRRADDWPHVRVETFELAKGTTPVFPAGHYSAAFWLELRCGGYRHEQLGRVSVRGTGRIEEQALACSQVQAEDGRGFSPLIVDFDLATSARLTLEVQYDQGYVAIDRIEIARRSTSPGLRVVPTSVHGNTQGAVRTSK